MADICRSCTMRAQRSAVSAVRRQTQSRSFSASAAALKGNASLPAFTETSSPDLDDVLVQLRTKHFIPAYLNKRQRHLIFGDKFTQELANNPAYATIGDEEIPLAHIDRRSEIPARRPLVLKALDLMNQNHDWRQLPSLLEGLHKVNTTPDPVLQEKCIRKLSEADQFPIIIRCLRRAEQTGLSLKDASVLDHVMWALRLEASKEGWTRERLETSIRHANDIAELLESTEHGSGRRLLANDPRTRPEVIGLFLELHAVYAMRHQQATDVNAKVKTYAERLMACVNSSNQPAEEPLPPFTLPLEFCKKMSIWHGLSLAKAILGNDMPQSQRANELIQNYGHRLNTLAESLRAEKRGYATLALAEWDACIRP